MNVPPTGRSGDRQIRLPGLQYVEIALGSAGVALKGGGITVPGELQPTVHLPEPRLSRVGGLEHAFRAGKLWLHQPDTASPDETQSPEPIARGGLSLVHNADDERAPNLLPVLLEFPQGYPWRGSITTDSGDISAEYLGAEELEIHTGSGSTQVIVSSIGRLSVESESGTVSVRGVVATGDISIVTSTGNITAMHTVVQRLAAISDGGDVLCDNVTGDVHAWSLHGRASDYVVRGYYAARRSWTTARSVPPSTAGL